MSIKRRKNVPDATAASAHSYADDVRGARHPMLQGQHLDVYQFVKQNPKCTREDVSRGTGIKSSTATARVKELIDEGFLVEPPYLRKKNRTGVKARVLQVSKRAAGGKPLDRVRIEVRLTVDRNGIYGAEARVIYAPPQTSGVHQIAKKRFTLTAPHPDTYKSAAAENITNISSHELQENAEDIIDADFVVVAG